MNGQVVHHLKAKPPSKLRIGVFPENLDGLVLSRCTAFADFFVLAPKRSPDARWARSFFPRANLLSFESGLHKPRFMASGLKDYLPVEDFKRLLRANKIKKLLVDAGISGPMNSWARQQNISLEPALFSFQERFEDKIWFDRYLSRLNVPRPRSLVWRVASAPKSLPLKARRVVLQTRSSNGAEGTFYLSKAAELSGLLAEKKLAKNDACLLRAYAEGAPCGISVLVTPELVALSAARLQCFAPDRSLGPGLFLGVQWLKSNFFSRAAASRLTQIFTALGSDMQKRGYFGFVNYDFILTGDDRVLLIECNPRFSACTCMIMLYPELLSGIEAAPLLVKGLASVKSPSRRKISVPFPQSSFAGSSFRLLPAEQGSQVKRTFPSGVYRFSNSAAPRYIRPDLRTMSGDEEFCFYTAARKKERYVRPETLGLLYSAFALFDNSGRVNVNGKRLSRFFTFD